MLFLRLSFMDVIARLQALHLLSSPPQWKCMRHPSTSTLGFFFTPSGSPPVFLVLIMDNILRELECLSRHELVWLNTYSAGRLRALPPASVQHLSPHQGKLQLGVLVIQDPWQLRWHRYQSGLKRSTTPWTRRNALVPPGKGRRIISNNRCSLYKVVFSCGPRHSLLSLTSELRAGRRLLDQVTRRMLRRVLLVALERHRSPLAALQGYLPLLQKTTL